MNYEKTSRTASFCHYASFYHIVAVSAVLDVPVDELFAPALPNGRRARDLLEDYARISQENADLREETARLKALVDNLKDELLDFYRKSKVTG